MAQEGMRGLMLEDADGLDTDTVDEVVADLCQLNFTESLEVLNDEAEVEVIDQHKKASNRQGGSSALTEDDVEEDSDDLESQDDDDDDDDDEDSYKKRRRRRRAMIRARALSNLRRERGDDGAGGKGQKRKTNALCDDGTFEEFDQLDSFFEYRRKKKDPAALCPPPAPTRMKGGRKTLRRQAMANEVPEQLLKDMTAAILTRNSVLHTENQVLETNLGNPLHITYTKGPFNNAVLQHAILSQERMAEELALNPVKLEKVNLDRTLTQSSSSSSSFPKANTTLYDMAFETRDPLPLCLQLRVEQLCSVIVALNYAAMLNGSYRAPGNGGLPPPPLDIGQVILPSFRETLEKMLMPCFADPKNKHLDFWNIDEHKQDFGNLLQDAERNSLDNERLLKRVGTYYTEALDYLAKYINEIRVVKRAKEFIQYKLEDLHSQLSVLPTKYDELGITGTRYVKLFLTAPYFKTPDKLMCSNFSDPLCKLPYAFRLDKQKWTQKDMVALSMCIKDSIIERAVQFLEARYQDLEHKSMKRAEEEIMANDMCFDEFNQPIRRGRGRPSKADVEKRDKYGVIKPIYARLPNGSVVFRVLTPKKIGDERMKLEKRYRGMSFADVINSVELGRKYKIDWNDVSEKVMARTRKIRSPEDCRLVFKHELDPVVNSRRFDKAEDEKLKKIVANPAFRNNWTLITNEMNRGAKRTYRTSFYLYTRYKALYPTPRLEWTEEMDNRLRILIDKYPGEWDTIADEMDDERISSREVVERYKKALNPMLRVGAFSRVEDCLLLVTLERLKPFLLGEGHFGSLLSYLPWRYETTWRDRANNLFNDWIVPWTLEEDLKLLELAVTYKRNWQKISEEFTSFKNRKGCLTRYKILDRHLKDERFKADSVRESLELYHEAYSMTRYNVFQYQHLYEVLEILTRVQKWKADPKNQAFLDSFRPQVLDPNREPNEKELCRLLLSTDPKLLHSAIQSVRAYQTSRDFYWKDWIRDYGDKKRTFDRRTFHKDNPQSVASAIHIRGLQLKEKHEVEGPELNEFEEDVYMYFRRFARTKPLKTDAERPYLPSPADLIQWPRVARIIATTLEDAPSFKGSCNLKWKRKGMPKPKPSRKSSSSTPGAARGGRTGRGRGRGRPPKRPRYELSDESDSSTTITTEEEEDFNSDSSDHAGDKYELSGDEDDIVRNMEIGSDPDLDEVVWMEGDPILD